MRYELDETMALYGAIPFVVSHGIASATASATAVAGSEAGASAKKRAGAPATTTVGALWLNPSETYVDVGENAAATETQVLCCFLCLCARLLNGQNVPRVCGRAADELRPRGR